MSTKVTYLKGSTKRICQLTGEKDRERGNTDAFNKTETNWGLIGTDLGASFDDGARTYFLFGDSHTNHPNDTYRPPDGDAIAYTTDTSPEPGIKLTFITADDKYYLSPRVPGVDPGSFNVPVGGFVVGANKYIFFTTGHTDRVVMGHAVLAVTSDFITFTKVYELPALTPHKKTPLIDICPLVADNSTIPGLPDSTGQIVLLWGSGQHRHSNPHLAYQPIKSLKNTSTIRYFAGLSGNTPQWAKEPENAAPLFEHPFLGELSVTYNKFLRRWVMLYNSSDLNKPWIICRVSETPWGPWSDGETIFNPCTEGGFCHFIHYNGTPPRDPKCHALQPCPKKLLSDTGRESKIGGPYGPYQISRYAKAAPNGTTIYWLMSTWNPYNVMLMKSTLVMA